MDKLSPPTLNVARSVERVLKPRSIAIIGASADPRSFGGFVLANLERFGYAGELHLVSRSSAAISGRPCVGAVDDLPEGIDLAVLAIPESGVLEAVRVLGEKRTSVSVIFASGYAETGEEGRARQAQIAEMAHGLGMALVGPNCMGFTNFEQAVPVTFEPVIPYPCNGRPGVAVLAQSGAMAANLRDAFIGRGIPLTQAVSTGNEASLGVEDYLAHFVADEQVRCIALYAEQLRRPQLFLEIAANARAAAKPIVMLMPGKSDKAREAAQSHTGALSGDHALTAAILQSEGVVIVDSLDELFDTVAILYRFPVPPSGAPAVMTASGAVKNIALDFAEDIGLQLPAFSAATVAKLKEKLPSYAVPENPLDYTTIGVRNPGLVGELIDIVLADEDVGSIILSLMGGPSIAQKDKADHVLPALARTERPAVLVIMGDNGPLEPFFIEAIQQSGVPFFRSPDRALRALKRVSLYGQALDRIARRIVSAPPPVALPAPVPPSGVFAEYQGKSWLKSIGLPIPEGGLAKTADEAVSIAAKIGYPVVIKAQASELPHKSDVGGVLVGLADEAALRAAWETLLKNIATHRPQLVLDGVLVEAMGARGLELVIGAKRDPEWGAVVLIGMGGVWIEVLKDFRLLPAALSEQDVLEEINSLKAAPLLKGGRGAKGVNLNLLTQAVAEICRQMQANPDIMEIDINPLIAYPDSILALDALIVAKVNS